jgi:hypothetical protein
MRDCELIDHVTLQWDEQLVGNTFWDIGSKLVLATLSKRNLRIFMHGNIVIKANSLFNRHINCMSGYEMVPKLHRRMVQIALSSRKQFGNHVYRKKYSNCVEFSLQ